MTDASPDRRRQPRHERWIVYLSKDRHVLWVDAEGPDGALPDDVAQARARSADGCPLGLACWNPILDAAYASRVPQYGSKRVTIDGEERLYTLKAFPDLTLDGEMKGLIQVVERADAVDWRTDHKKAVNGLLDLTLSGLILYQPDGDRVLNVNRRIAQQTGYPVSELERMAGKDLFGAPGVAMLRGIFARMLKAGDGMIWGQELTIRDNYGQENHYLCSLRTLAERPGPDSPMAMAISIDAAASDWRATGIPSGPNQTFIMKAMRDSIWEFDLDKNLMHYSRRFAELFGPDGMEGRAGKPVEDWAASVHPDDLQNLYRSWRQLLKRGDHYNIQYRFRDSDGDWHWILSTIHAILNDASGRPKKVIGAHLEITESIRTEQNLVDAEERLRMIFDNAGIGIAVAAVDGCAARVNPALAIMLGRDREDIEGRRIGEFCHPDDREEVEAILARLLRSGRRETILEQRFLRPDGKPLWANLTATLSQKGVVGDRYVILMMENVTERHERQVKIQYRATHDVMTGAWNRYVLNERLGQHISLAIRHRQPMAFCICDLDHFKTVNDAHGHQAGDRVLVEFVRLLKESVRDTDIVGRYGGEEFGIIFPNTSVEGARQSMERTRKLLRETVFTDDTGDSFRVTATFGVAGAGPGSTPKNLVSTADSALYDGKEQGRDRVVARQPEGGSPDDAGRE